MKALLVHTIAFFACLLMILYILGDQKSDVLGRVGIVIFFLFFQFIAYAICDYRNFYNSKCKEK